jgi:CheY-like chemotaxis protein
MGVVEAGIVEESRSGKQRQQMESTLRLSNKVRETLHQIAGLIELASEEPLSETQSQYLSRCRESADQLVRTANDLAELDRGEVAATVAPFASASTIGEVAELMGVLAARKGLKFDWSIDRSVPARILADKLLLQDTLRRLLDNAVRFTETGGVRLSVTTTNLTNHSAVLNFEISDSGPGIDQSILAAIESTDDLRVQGLGLRIVRKRLAGLRGSFFVPVNSPAGSVVCFAMPVLIADDPKRSPEAGAGRETEGSPRMAILVAEDSDDSFRLFQAYTKAGGYLISRAMNGAEAVEMFQAGEYDFVVMDANMPVMDGYTATRLIRQRETEQGRPRLPIVLFSTDDEKRQMHMGGAAGCSGYLTKPATKAQVLAALDFYALPVPRPRGTN